MEFAFVPAGTFEQGTPGDTDQERPYTARLTRDYFVSRTEVTQGQWKAGTRGTNPSCYQSLTGTECTPLNMNDNGPVERVDWYSAIAYANWLSTESGLQPCYSLQDCSDDLSGWHDGDHSGCSDAAFVGLDCEGYRLLTESEWERAARGGTTTSYYWGNSADPATTNQFAWFGEVSQARTQPVGQKLPNRYGLHDVSGTVSEWIWDWVYDQELRSWHFYPTNNGTDYTGPASGSFRGERGGFWLAVASTQRVSWRGAHPPEELRSDGQFGLLGFRLARTVP
jgi:formylglycine-generating enzyme required for sulfatase activity